MASSSCTTTGSEPERELVDDSSSRLEEQGLGQREHLLLAAGERAGRLVEPSAQRREQVEHRVDLAASSRAASQT